MTRPEIDLSPDERWAAASLIAAGKKDDNWEGRRKKILRVVGVAVGAYVVLLAVVGLCVALLIRGDHRPHRSSDDSFSTADWVALAFLAVGLAIMIGTLIWALRTRRLVTRWQTVLSPLNRAERRSVLRQIRGKEPVDPEHVAVVREAAMERRRSYAIIVSLPGWALVVASNLIFNRDTFAQIESYLGLGFIAFICVGTIIGYRRTNTFITSLNHLHT
ncbi:MAG: hypothetical protein JWN36_1074 [Microbacteriaceae bacterium]|nr:hypothetical protein [Microbacteriaceae bacterium]